MTAVEPTYVRRDEESGMYVVSGHDEANAVLRSDGWSSDPQRNPMLNTAIRQMPGSNLPFMDPPDHTRLRRLISPAFTPRVLNALRPRVVDIAKAALEGLPNEVDLLDDYAYLVPLAVIAEFLDVGAEGAEVLRYYAPAFTRLLEPDATPDELTLGTDASIELIMYLTPVIAERAQHPGDDFISLLLAQDGIKIDEVATTCLLLLLAGHETTANMIANGTNAILRQSDHVVHREQMLADPARAVEELLRLEGAVNFVVRTATIDQQVGDIGVPAGGVVFVDLRAVNTDPRRYEEPNRLDLSRAPQQHLAFGGGIHHCIGAALSRLELAEALPALFRHYPNLQLLDAEPDWRESAAFHSLNSLGVRLGADSAQL